MAFLKCSLTDWWRGSFIKYCLKKTVNIYVSLIISMIAGRIVWGYNAACHRRSCSRSVHLADVCERRGAYGSSGGIILHIILIPIIVIALKKAKLID